MLQKFAQWLNDPASTKQLKIGKTIGVLHSFVWNYAIYANMESFHRDNHIICDYPSEN